MRANARQKIPLFQKDTNGSARKQKYIMGRRNWCSVKWDESTGDVIFDIRVEKDKGLGRTVGYGASDFFSCAMRLIGVVPNVGILFAFLHPAGLQASGNFPMWLIFFEPLCGITGV
jgi:hypothetical protein